MNKIYTDAPEAIAVVQRAFPEYRHSASKLSIQEFHPITPTSYWSGGTRDYWALASLDGSAATGAVRENGSGFTEGVGEIREIPQGTALVRFTTGNYSCACIYLRPENLSKMLPAPVELTQDEAVVLVCSSGLTSAYRKEQMARNGLGFARIESAKALLINKKLMTKNGAVTTDGRNVANARPDNKAILNRYDYSFDVELPKIDM
jgi:hypothetical protein